jgi:glutaredoxin 3
MKAVVWSKDNCPYCVQALNVLEHKGVEVEVKKICDGGYTREQLLEEVPTARTLPQIFIDGELIGGFKELRDMFYKED